MTGIYTIGVLLQGVFQYGMTGQTQLKVSYQSDQQRRYKMTRKHFIKLAEALKSVKADIKTIDAIAKVCEEYNPNFDWFKFEQACREADNG
jgi:hypothetical protein